MKCIKCKKNKRLGAFYGHPTTASGWLTKCKECAKADARANYAANRERYRVYDRERAMRPDRVAMREAYKKTDAGRLAVRRATAASAARYPHKKKAAVTLNNAVRDGRVEKPKHCSSCGKGGRIHGHHDDYTKPLDVIWLCPACHTAHHKALEN